jgi:hypothetical protein
MASLKNVPVAGLLLALLSAQLACPQQQAPLSGQAELAAAPLPDIHQLMREVRERQKQLDKLLENYTYSSMETVQDLDANGHVTKTETEEFEEFYVNGHQIGRKVKKDGKPLEGQDLQKETERVTKLVETANKPDQTPPKPNQGVSLSQVLEVADIRNPRRLSYRGRPTLVFDFIGRKDLKPHGLSEDISKKVQGTVWIDEADRVVAHLEVTFNDNFHIAGGLVASIQKGSSFNFDQAPVNGEVWLPTGGEGTISARILLVKGIRQHGTERDYDYKRFRVETQQAKDAKVVPENQPHQ